jgi:hypothetical protein
MVKQSVLEGIYLPLFALTSGILFTGCPLSILASNDNYPAGARSAALSHVSVMYPDLWSAWHNQAGLGFYHKVSAGIHHENRFLAPELALSTACFTLPTSTGTFALSWSHFGYSACHENKFGIALGKAFHKKFSAGLQFNYLNLFINDDLGSSGTIAIEAGLMAEPVKDLLIGFHVFNPTAARQSRRKGEHIPVILRFGLGYRFGEKIFFGVETSKDLDIETPVTGFGLEYRLFDYIYIRTGLSVQEHVRHSFGVGCNFRKFQADIAFTFHQVLGYTPGFSLSYAFN